MITRETFEELQIEMSHLRGCLEEAKHDNAALHSETLRLRKSMQELEQEREEILALKAQLEQQVAEQQARLDQQSGTLQHIQSLLQGIAENSPASIFVKDREGRFLLINNRAASFLHRTPDQLVGKADHEIFPPDMIARWHNNDRPVFERGEPIQTEVVLHHEDGLRTYITTRFPLYNTQGDIYAIAGISTDITERNRTEAAEALTQLKITDVELETFRSLATPLIPIAERVVAMPLIGTIDAIRAQQVIETLLQGVAEHSATIAILDITGVKRVDAHVAAAIVQAAQAVRLLGSKVVLTGIHPKIAQTLVHLQVDLSGIITRSTLQSGIAYALQHY